MDGNPGKKVGIFILREPQPGEVEAFLRTEEGDFLIPLTRRMVWQIHNETGMFLFSEECFKHE
jgi:hypothetical protein